MRDQAALKLEADAQRGPTRTEGPGGGAPGDVSAPNGSLKSTAARGAVWAFAGYGGGQLLRFGGNLILTRMLFTEAFGLMALVNVFLQGLQLFSDIGIGPSIIQNARGDERRFLDTAWTMQVARGVLLFAAACAAALPIAGFYDEPSLAALLPVAAATTILSGFASTKLFTLNRHLALGRLTLLELGSQVVGLATMVAWARLSPSVWALVAGSVAVTLVKTVGSHALLPGTNNRLAWSSDAARAVFHFGKWIFLSTVLTFLVGQSDRLVFGKLIPLGMLGVYSIGLMIAFLPQMALGHVALSLVFPLYSRIHNRGEDIVPTFRRVRLATLTLGAWMLSGLIAGGQAAVELLYDWRYVDAGWVVQVLSLGGWFFALEASNGAGLLALGRASWVAASNAGKLVGMLVLIPIGYQVYGFPGAVCGFALAEVFKYAVSAYAASRAALPGRLQDLGLTALLFAAAHLGWIAERRIALAGGGPGARSLVVLAVSTVLFLPLGVHLFRSFHSQGRSAETRGDA